MMEVKLTIFMDVTPFSLVDMCGQFRIFLLQRRWPLMWSVPTLLSNDQSTHKFGELRPVGVYNNERYLPST
jgi:hypothetical protein